MSHFKSLLLTGFLSCAGAAALGEPPEFLQNVGPIFSEFDLTLSSGHRIEALGPLFYHEWNETQETLAFPPLWSLTTDPSMGFKEFDLLYPIITYDVYGTQHRWQFCQVLNVVGGPTSNDTIKNRHTLFPIYWDQRSSDPSENYTAVFPFYGTLRRHFFRDEIFFVMFPFYGQSRKKDVVTDNYLYPLFHLRHGDGLTGWQFWPLIGHEHKDVTTRTNGFNEIQTIPAHDNRFVLWPLYFNDHTGLGTTNPIWMQGSLPLYSIERSPARDSTTIIWPFFSHIDSREKGYREWDAPWPLIEFARGPGKTTSRVWPFFSQAHSPTLESDFYLWPIYKYNRARLDPLDRRRSRVVFFLYDKTIDKNTETGAQSESTSLWPFYLYRRSFTGNERLQVLAVLEPFLRGSHKIPRDYSPIWSIWRTEKNPKTGTTSHSLLWNLYRSDSSPKEKKVSAICGLFQHQSTDETSRTRLFYITVSHKKSRAVAVTPPKSLSE